MDYIEGYAIAGQNNNIVQLIGNVRLTPQRTDTFYFSSQEARDSWFDSKVIYTWNNCMYVRDDRGFKVPVNHENMRESSYMRFRNAHYNGVWIYCFIEKTDYINANTTIIHFSVDSWMTYQFDVVFAACDVAREHESSNAPYNSNTVPEGLYLGDYVLSKVIKQSLDTNTFIIVSAVNLMKSAGTVDDIQINASAGGVYQNIPSTCSVYVVNADDTDDIYGILSLIEEYPWISSNILSISVFPKELLPAYSVQRSELGFDIGVLGEGQPKSLTKVITQNWMSEIGVRSDSKLYTYPYCYIELCMPDGSSCILRPELLEGNLFTIYVQGVCVPSSYVSAQALRYGAQSGSGQDSRYGAVFFGGFPSFPVQNDNYMLAKAQAESNYSLNQQQRKESNWIADITDALKLSSAVFSGDADAIVQGGTSLANRIVDNYHASQNQRRAIGQMSGNVSQAGAGTSGMQTMLYAYDKFEITVRFWTIRNEYVNRITQFFDMYGHAVNMVKIPNISLRRRYNYVKCSTVNIFGNIPHEYLNEIRNMFLTGATFWRDYDNVGVYGNNANI